MVEPNRPAITPAQIVALLVAGIPAVAKLLAAFGVYTVSAAQQDALTGVLTWAGVVAGVLIGADAALRAARNSAHAKAGVALPRVQAGLTQPVYTASAGTFTPATGGSGGAYWATSTQKEPVKPGDPDALPEFATKTDPPADGNDQAVEA